MSAQVALIVGGLIFIGAAIAGSGQFVNIKIKELPKWARVCCAALGVALFALAFVPGVSITSSSDSTSPGSTGALSSSNARAAQTGLRITYPTPGSIVLGSKGVMVKGTASGLKAGESGWLFDSNSSLTDFNEDYNPEVGQEPVVAGNYRWSFLDVPIGVPGDNGQTYTLVIVRASPACSKILGQRTEFTRLPTGCHIDDETEIIVNYPKPK